MEYNSNFEKNALGSYKELFNVVPCSSPAPKSDEVVCPAYQDSMTKAHPCTHKAQFQSPAFDAHENILELLP